MKTVIVSILFFQSADFLEQRKDNPGHSEHRRRRSQKSVRHSSAAPALCRHHHVLEKTTGLGADRYISLSSERREGSVEGRT